jgi:hypothetical protein
MKKLFFLSALLLPSVSFAEFVDKTDSFREFFTSHFIGSSSDGAETWDMTYCILKNPISGDCSEKAGYKIKGTGSGTVTELTEFSGKGVAFDVRRSPWDTGAPAVLAPWIDVKMTYNYEGRTTGKKQCYPANFFCGYEWEDLNPGGRIEILVTSTPDGVFNVEVRYAVLRGHADKPNRVVENAMSQLRERSRYLVEAWLRGESCNTNVILK